MTLETWICSLCTFLIMKQTTIYLPEAKKNKTKTKNENSNCKAIKQQSLCQQALND